MDILAHTIYGATVCSRSGLAGGRQGAGRRWFADGTVWWASFFGVVPDALSMGFPFLFFWLDGMPGNFFREMDSEAMVHYRYAHSLLAALAFSGLLFFLRRPLCVPSLAWALHLVMDAATHGAGKYRTTLFYPLSEWGFDGISWWRHPKLALGYWLLLPAIWLGLWMWRRGRPSGFQ